MKLGEHLARAADEWAEGAFVIACAAVLASIAMAATFIAASLLGDMLGKPDWWGRMIGEGSAFLWYPVAAGKVIRHFRRSDLSAPAPSTQDQPSL